MERYPFIFSDEWNFRFRRHFYFWTLWWLFQSFLYSFIAGGLNVSYFERLPIATLDALLFLIPHIFLAYSLMYFVVPRYLLKAKYMQAALEVVILFLLTGTISSLISVYWILPVRRFIFGPHLSQPHVNEVRFFLGLLAGLRGAITIGGLAAAIKLMKYWYVKEQRNLQLQKENISSQLQLLKAQVHPHFLFNTLNNIYSSTQVTSPAAAKMIMGLSQLLRYMLYECNRPLVPLSRELKMLEEYMLLEKSRYGNALEMHIAIPSADTELAIAPLLLLPFVENSFKHGTSHMLEQPWISLTISVESNWMKMKLLNGKVEGTTGAASGIGLNNVRRRLELLYPNRHELIINNEEEVFIVNLKILLEKSVAEPIHSPNRVAAESYA
jgi:sensor histidine kinase YesM